MWFCFALFFFSVDPTDAADFHTQLKRKQWITRGDSAKMALGLKGQEESEDSICFRPFRFDLGFSVVLNPHVLYDELC